ncbi:MAG: putative sulfate exporter family transporter, partial [Armatimonadota bacterium]
MRPACRPFLAVEETFRGDEVRSPEIEMADAQMRRAVVWRVCCEGIVGGWPGTLLCLALAGVAWWLGLWFPLVGGPVFAILLGIVVGNALKLPTVVRPGLAFCSKRVLQYSIILLGGGMSLIEVYHVGARSLVVMLATLTCALVIAWLIGRVLKVDSKLTSLVGVGTGICGGSAIAAIAPIIDADDDEIAFA